ncbi:MAG: hypothetical protein K1X82_03350 [Bacteroidia bacterium]|nr:hypothetical protein [Bacteroidia bacterium]
MHFKKTLLLFLLFACVGITAEIFFTAIYDAVKQHGTPHFSLKFQGQSYIWMFPIYGCISFMGPILVDRIHSWNIFLRALIYAVVIFSFEFLSGWLLEVFTGSCPWKYREGLHIAGYIRLDYAVAWMGFGLMVEQIYLFASKVLDHFHAHHP